MSTPYEVIQKISPFVRMAVLMVLTIVLLSMISNISHAKKVSNVRDVQFKILRGQMFSAMNTAKRLSVSKNS